MTQRTEPRLYDLPGCGEWEDAHDGYQRTVGAYRVALSYAVHAPNGRFADPVLVRWSWRIYRDGRDVDSSNRLSLPDGGRVDWATPDAAGRSALAHLRARQTEVK